MIVPVMIALVQLAGTFTVRRLDERL